jgi:YHS domain-containing protein
VKDPESYINSRKVEIPCAVHPEQKAIVTPEMRVRLNHEIFYFSSAKARREFLANPLHYCGKLTDPVNHDRFAPNAKSPHTTFDDRTYYFEADSTYQRFKADPEPYAERFGS